MLKGVLIAFDMILMIIFFGMGVYSAAKSRKKDTAVICWIFGAVIALNEVFIFLA